MASQAYRNILAVLSLCESYALSLCDSHTTSLPSNICEISETLQRASKEAREQWSMVLTKREADTIVGGMRLADQTYHHLMEIRLSKRPTTVLLRWDCWMNLPAT